MDKYNWDSKKEFWTEANFSQQNEKKFNLLYV